MKNFTGIFAETFLEEANQICMHLDKVADKNLMIDLQDLLLRSTLDSFCKISMGVSIGALTVEAAESNGFYTLPTVPFMEAFDGTSGVLLFDGMTILRMPLM